MEDEELNSAVEFMANCSGDDMDEGEATDEDSDEEETNDEEEDDEFDADQRRSFASRALSALMGVLGSNGPPSTRSAASNVLSARFRSLPLPPEPLRHVQDE